MKADAFVTNKVLFKQSNGAVFYVILSLFSLISSFCQEEENNNNNNNNNFIYPG